MFGLFKKKAKKTTRLVPESRWIVTVGASEIRVTDDKGIGKSVYKYDLTGVVIETNDTGPWGADVWWLLFGAGDQLACTFPQGATGEKAAIDFLIALPSFNHEEMIKAMGSTSNATFPVWRRT